ncbi:LOW QUALITY PROTEIN: fibulin-2 [Peromyscus californicus insignis]|uniref:LOW QUALITY PROTEIN: fibulin-2 n=1 Tax=Peromyscus californicus insignis TaxID=564181 RepID=UPI0022A7833F|nr:LOW QUALITY PROTEIN: fibulin-2 [Peromyscus californicus insignis]
MDGRRRSAAQSTGASQDMMLLQESAGAWLALALVTALTLSPGMAVPWQDCTGAECPPLENCIEEALEPGACCATCVRQGCACEGYQYYDCVVHGGFVDGRVPAGQSYFVDFGSTECSCPPGGGKITCQFMLCPELPPNCIEAVVVADSCPQCGQVGCVHSGRKYAAGHTVHLSPCRACHCPDAGGELICYQLPGCQGNFSDAEEGDSERQYEDPYSYDQEVAEAETPMATVNEIQAGAEGPPAALGGGNLPPSSIRATPRPAALPRPTAAAALGPPAPMQAKARRVTQDIDEEEEEQAEETVATEPSAAGGPGRLNSLPTTPPAIPDLPGQEKEAEAKAGLEENFIPDAQATPPSAGQEGAAPLPRLGPAGLIPSLTTDSSPGDPVKSSSHPILSTRPPDRAQVTPSPEVPEELPHHPQSRPPSQAEEDIDPNSVHSVPRGDPDGSTKDLIETCCAAGQQWAIDNDECQEIPENGADSDVCRIAQRHCCVSYLKEKSCMAGIVGAKEGEACGAEDNDTCGVSLYKQCCDCCGLGLRVRAEGQSCDSNPNLGYPCNHVMLSCCEGEDPLIVPEVRRPPEPEATPRRVSEAEMASREALSLGTEAELPNSLPGDDQDECLLLPGELCQHLCINTVGSYRCACFPGFELQGDGRTCRPDGGAPRLDAARESAPRRSESAQVSPNTIPLPVPQPNTCRDNGPCQQVCRVVGGTAMCSCFPGYAIMADGVSCEDQDECLMGTHDCSWQQFCVNTLGSFYCVNHTVICAEGYILNAHRKCVDINECVTDLHTCTRDEHCVNTPGSFQCYKALTCEPGYALTDGECTDVDECVTGTHNCQPGFSCQNTKGSFYCQARQRCMDGFLQDPEGNCVDINECTSLLEPCRSGFSCVNTVGSYTCQRNPLICRRGYHANEDGSECVDVNECETGVHRCGEGQLCHNLPGSYRCDCKPGFQRDAFGRTCIDVNECWVSPGRLCQHTCENTPGSYRCSCATGFILAADGKHCEDVNECENQRCSQECANIYGSYQCYCRQGYQLAEDGHSCTDIDECAQGAGILCTFRCVNVPGSYQCACPEQGYTMMANGRSCKDLDECALGTHNCSEAETCYNIQGSFRCLRFECPPNYVRVSEMKCERTTCQDITECQTSPARITHYQLNFQIGLLVPAHIFRIGPAPAFAGDTISLTITKGNEEGYFVTSRLNAYTGVVSLQRSVLEPRDFALDVEMKLWRQGSVTTFLAKMYIFFTTFAP